MVDRGRGVGAGPGSFDVTSARPSPAYRAAHSAYFAPPCCFVLWCPLCDCLWALPRLLLRLLGRPYAPCGCFVGGFATSCCVVRGAPFLLMSGLVGAPLPVGTSLPIVTPLLVAPLLRALSLLVAVLPLAPPLVVLQSAPAAHPG